MLDKVKTNIVEIGGLVNELALLLAEKQDAIEEEMNFMTMATNQIKNELDKLKTYVTTERYKVHGTADKH